MIDTNILNIIKKDYVSQLEEIYQRYPIALRNIDKVSSCKFIINNNYGVSAVADSETNSITLGTSVDACTVFHELDHIRKGTMQYYETKYKSPEFFIDEYYNVSVEGMHRGIFFDEAITEYMAQYMIKNSQYSDSNDIKSLQSRGFYNNNLRILEMLADALDMKVIDLCLQIDAKHLNGFDGIDKIFQSKGFKYSFDEFEMLLDDYETCHNAQFIARRDGGLVANDGTRARGFDPEYVNRANKSFELVENILNEAIEKKK